MPIAQAKAIVHRHTQGDRVKVKMLADHFKVIPHGVGLSDSVVNRKNSAGKELLRVKFVKVVQLPLFVGIQKDEVETPLKFYDFRMRVTLDTRYSLR
jgi:hypothetical protein